jgi:hypothetical protein
MPGNIINLTPADVLAWPKPNYENPVRRTWNANILRHYIRRSHPHGRYQVLVAH